MLVYLHILFSLGSNNLFKYMTGTFLSRTFYYVSITFDRQLGIFYIFLKYFYINHYEYLVNIYQDFKFRFHLK